MHVLDTEYLLTSCLAYFTTVHVYGSHVRYEIYWDIVTDIMMRYEWSLHGKWRHTSVDGGLKFMVTLLTG